MAHHPGSLLDSPFLLQFFSKLGLENVWVFLFINDSFHVIVNDHTFFLRLLLLYLLFKVQNGFERALIKMRLHPVVSLQVAVHVWDRCAVLILFKHKAANRTSEMFTIALIPVDDDLLLLLDFDYVVPRVKVVSFACAVANQARALFGESAV